MSVKELYDISQNTARLQIPIYSFEGDGSPPLEPRRNDQGKAHSYTDCPELTFAGIECVATIAMDWTNFSGNFTKTLRKKMERESTAFEALELSISLAVNDLARLCFEARTGTSRRIVVGSGMLRYDDTEA